MLNGRTVECGQFLLEYFGLAANVLQSCGKNTKLHEHNSGNCIVQVFKVYLKKNGVSNAVDKNLVQ